MNIKKLIISLFAGLALSIAVFVLTTTVGQDNEVSPMSVFQEAQKIDTSPQEKYIETPVITDSTDISQTSRNPIYTSVKDKVIVPSNNNSVNIEKKIIAPEEEYLNVGSGQTNNNINSTNSHTFNEADTNVYWKIENDQQDNFLTLYIRYGATTETGWTQNNPDKEKGTPGWFGSFMSVQKVVVDQSMNQDNAAISHTKSWFSTSYQEGKSQGLPHVTKFVGLKYINFSKATDTSFMYTGVGSCGAVTSTDTSNDFNLPEATNIDAMFNACHSKEIFGGSPVVTTSDKLTNCRFLFQNETTLETVDMTKLNLSNVADLSYMFCGCESLTSTKENPLVFPAEFNFQSKTNMTAFFCYCINVKFNYLDLQSWGNPQENATLQHMFNTCSNLKTIYVAQNTDWSSTKGDCTNMFKDCQTIDSEGKVVSALTGCNGTAYNSSHDNANYARVDFDIDFDGNEHLGYFTAISFKAVVSGSAKNDVNDKSITFYYDDVCHKLEGTTTYYIPKNKQASDEKSVPWKKEANYISNIQYDKSYTDVAAADRPGMNYWFESFNKLIDIPNLPEGEDKVFAEGLFKGCNGFKCVHLNTRVTSLGKNCFKECKELRKFVVGDYNEEDPTESELANVGSNVFNGSTHLENFIVRKTSGELTYDPDAFAGAGSTDATVAAPLVVADNNAAGPTGVAHYVYTPHKALEDSFTFEHNKYYFLTEDSALPQNSKEIVGNNVDCIIDLNGKKIDKGIAEGDAKAGGNVFEIISGATFRIDDTSTLTDTEDKPMGSITGGRTNGENAGYGSNAGGGAYIAGTLNFVNGKISHCAGNEGGGLALSANKTSQLNMYGGIITNCKTNRPSEAAPSTKAWGGGAIFARTGSSVNLYRGTIINNTTRSLHGGSVYMNDQTTLKLSADMNISNSYIAKYLGDPEPEKGEERYVKSDGGVCLGHSTSGYEFIGDNTKCDSMMEKSAKAILFFSNYSKEGKIGGNAKQLKFIYDAYNNHINEQSENSYGEATGGIKQFDIYNDGNFAKGEDVAAKVPWHSFENYYKKDITQIDFHESFKGYKLTSTQNWFRDQQVITGFSGFANMNTSNVVSMERMFNDMGTITSLNVSELPIPTGTTRPNMDYWLSGSSTLTSLTLADACYNPSTAKGTFRGIKCNITNLGKFCGEATTSLYQCLSVNSNTTSFDLSGWDTSSVTDMSYMFEGCSTLTTVVGPGTLNNNTSVGTSCTMKCICQGCSSLTSFSFAYCDITNVDSFDSAFKEIHSLKTLDFSKGSPAKSTKTTKLDTHGMLDGGTTGNMALTTFYVEPEADWITKCNESAFMFSHCVNLVGQEGTSVYDKEGKAGDIGKAGGPCTCAQQDKAKVNSNIKGYFSSGYQKPEYVNWLAAKSRTGVTEDKLIKNGHKYRISRAGLDGNINIKQSDEKVSGSAYYKMQGVKDATDTWIAHVQNNFVVLESVEHSGNYMNLNSGNKYGGLPIANYTEGVGDDGSCWIVTYTPDSGYTGGGYYQILSKKDANLAMDCNLDSSAYVISYYNGYMNNYNNRRFYFIEVKD